MKKTILATALFLGIIAFKADAQLKINFNLNIGSQPDWGPTGYDHVEYYYMPDIDAYYYVPGHQYVYQQNNAWIRSAGLPPRFSNYNLYHSYKVVVNQPEPWRNQAAIRAKYASYRGRRNQVVIRDSRDSKYRNHWQGDNKGRRENNHGQGDDHQNYNRSHDYNHYHSRPDRDHGHNPDRDHGHN